MITSASNPQVKRVAQLCKKAKERKDADLFIVEGPKMFLEAPKERIEATYVSSYFYEKFKNSPDLKGRDFEVVADQAFAAMSDTKTPQGVICLVKQYHYTLDELLKTANGKAPLIMVLENLQDPGNLGTIMRTAEGAGVTGVLMTSTTVDLYNPKVIRSTMGSIYRMPFHYTDNLEGALNYLKEKGIHLYAAHLKGKTWYDEEDYKTGTAFLIGNESKGLTDKTADMADTYIRIPMEGKVESLNAAVASSILMYEASRQRRN